MIKRVLGILFLAFGFFIILSANAGFTGFAILDNSFPINPSYTIGIILVASGIFFILTSRKYNDTRKLTQGQLEGFIQSEPGTNLDDFMHGNWRPEEVIGIFESYAMSEEDIQLKKAERVIERSELTRSELLKLRDVIKAGYDARSNGTGQYSHLVKSRDPKIAEHYGLLVKYIDRKLR